ncbi:HEPN domain-containing protein [Aureispira anguillae]|uniref:HEPN domain-containing protein n=1 Tax=Aureispira anguillae TaxID=2864201 RepID=A0A915YH94_9BACT|nr:HEPN domain-containing protein [Aureispira anguillae]BDS12979.1 HEPN domain-containing protein [Aureispira anguillae]
MDYICTFLNSIHGLELNFNIDDFLFEDLNLKIKNESKIIDQFYKSPILKITGSAQYQKSIQLKSYLWSEFPAPKKDFNEKIILAHLLKLSTIFSNAAWIVKDNSVRFELGHFQYTDGKFVTIHSNIRHSLYTNCLGDKEVTNFSEPEITEAIKYFNFFFNLKSSIDDSEPEMTHAQANRIKRAYYFIDSARTSFDIGTKVSLYCSAFECLFSISNSELTHRLSETVANFLENSFTEKKDIYNKMKKIYSLRSSITHGSGIKRALLTNNSLKLKKIGRDCDNILRRCLEKIIADDTLTSMYSDNNNDIITTYLTDLNFK